MLGGLSWEYGMMLQYDSTVSCHTQWRHKEETKPWKKRAGQDSTGEMS